MFRKKADVVKADSIHYRFLRHKLVGENIELVYEIVGPHRFLSNILITVVLPEKDVSLDNVRSELRNARASIMESHRILGPIYDNPVITLED